MGINPTNQSLQNPTPAQTEVMPSFSDIPDADFPIDTTDTVELSESPDAIYHYFIASPMYAGFGDLASPERIQFLENLRIASPALKNYLTSADTVELIFSIGKGYDLQDIQITELGVLVRDLLAGKIFIKDFPATLSSKLGIDDIKAEGIVNKIVSQSFGPIIEDVKRVQRSKFPDKVMAMQKESRPTGLTHTPNEARPGGTVQSKEIPPKPQVPEIKNTPSSQPEIRQNIQPVRPPIPVPPIPPKVEAKPPVLGTPLTPPSQPKPQAPFQPKPSIPQQALRSEAPKLSTQPSIPRPTPGSQQFKVPDLGDLSTSNLPRSNPAQTEIGSARPEETKKSLEEELLKVANIIDLRSKQGEQQ